MKIKRRGLGLRIFRFLKKLFIFLFLFQFFYLLLIKWVNPPITLTQLSSVFAFDGLKRDYVDMKEISSYAKLAVIASEDQLFAEHNGFDWKGIEKAIEYNKTNEGKKVRGASTISQQVAKNVFLWQGRSWFRKGMEVYFTFMIEWLYPKERILELYLNVAEMGTGVYGIEAAAQHYFKKPAAKLNRKEAAMIAACLPNPKIYTVQPASKYVNRKYPWILKQMTNIQRDPNILALIQ